MNITSLKDTLSKPPTRNRVHLGIIDSCGGNLTSLIEALWKLEVSLTISSDPKELSNADGLVLPGVGAARETMERLVTANLVEFIKTWDKPLLGICIGMQILFTQSEEGATFAAGGLPSTLTPLLGKIPGIVRRIPKEPGYPVPHMGFNDVHWNDPHCHQDEKLEGCFYFVHSYYAPEGPWVLAHADYGRPIPAVIRWGQTYGVQFHPEKSQGDGLKLLRNFVEQCVSSRP